MKKRWWLLIVVFVLAGTSYGAYKYFFDRDVTPSEVHVQEDFFDFSEVIQSVQNNSPNNPEGTQTAQSGNQQTVQTVTSTDSATGSSTTSATGSSNSTEIDTESHGAGTKVTEEDIKAKYFPAFDKLRSLAIERLDQLAANAKTEYKKSKTEGNPPLTDIFARYSSAAKKLQSKVDETFYSLLEQMEKDLQAAKLPLDLVEMAEVTYESAISQKRAELLSKISK